MFLFFLLSRTALRQPLAHQRTEPSHQGPRQKRGEQNACQPIQSARDHKRHGDGGGKREGDQHCPPGFVGSLTVQEEREDQSAQGAGTEEDEIVLPQGVGIELPKTEIKCENLPENGECPYPQHPI